MRITLAILCLLLPFLIQAQEVDINTLKSPENPAAILLDISPSDISNPQIPTGVSLSIQESSGGSSQLPSEYALEISPAWIFWGDQLSFKDEGKQPFFKMAAQNLTISTSVSSQLPMGDDEALTRLGFGFKTSLVKGKITDDTIEKLKDSSKKMRDKLDDKGLTNNLIDLDTITDNILNKRKPLDKANKKDTDEYRQLIEQELNRKKEIEEIKNKALIILAKHEKGELDKAEMKTQIKAIKGMELSWHDIFFDLPMRFKEKMNKEIEKNEFEIKRYGLKLDIAGGLSMRFSKDSLGNVPMYRSGIWLTGGYETQKGFSALGILRYLKNPNTSLNDGFGDEYLADISTFDYGAKLLYSPSGNKYSVSAEVIGRKVFNEGFDHIIKYSFNFEYQLKKDLNLVLGLGKNFNGEFTKDGNLSALLSLFAGFGSKRKVNMPGE